MKKENIFTRGVVAVLTLLLLASTIVFSANTVGAATTSVATETVKAMGAGWNLGRSLDSYSTTANAYEIAMQQRDKYQLMATYSTKTYSGWDAYGYPYIFATTSSGDLNWKITKLNSSLTQACGNFGIQIINNGLKNSGTNLLNYTITKAQFTKASGQIITLTDLLGTYSKVISNNTTAYIKADLTKQTQLLTSADLIGGTLSISVKINTYPMPAIPSVTKEAYYETLWGNLATTKSMIDGVKAAGYGSIRIPVTYTNHMDANGNIDKAWLDRVASVVQYALDNGLYCIINVHHDTGAGGWLKADATTYASTSAKFKTMWTQIATYFKGYSTKLLFEGYNELLNSANAWNYAGATSYSIANKLNQVFVSAVRATGGNNASRCLVVNTYAASTESDVINGFALPTDTVSGRLIVEAHYYGTTTAGIVATMSRLNTKFVSKGIPVIIGEFGSTYATSEATRSLNAGTYVREAKKYNIACFWWDDGNYFSSTAKCNYALFNRYTNSWFYQSISDAIVTASK